MTAEVKLACEHVWKLFGPAPGRFLQAYPGAGPEQLAAAGLIGAVRDASLAIRAGEIFVIMGLSGSGKSTLVRCMSRLVEPTAGRILFEGENLLAAPPKHLIEIRRHERHRHAVVAALGRKELLDRIFPPRIRRQAVERVGRKGDDAPALQDCRGFRHEGGVWVNG